MIGEKLKKKLGKWKKLGRKFEKIGENRKIRRKIRKNNS